MKIKGLAEPERPIEKSVKRLVSPPRLVGAPLQHGPLNLLQQHHVSSPSAKRKRLEPPPSSYTIGVAVDKEDHRLAATIDNGLGSIAHSHQVVLLPPPTIDHHPTSTSVVSSSNPPLVSPADLSSSQPNFVSHHTTLVSDGLLCSVSGTSPAIYVGSTHGGTESRTDHDSYPVSSDYHNSNNNSGGSDTPGPSGVTPGRQLSESPMVRSSYDVHCFIIFLALKIILFLLESEFI